MSDDGEEGGKLVLLDHASEEGRLLRGAMRARTGSAEGMELRGHAARMGLEQARSLARANLAEPLVGVGLLRAGIDIGRSWADAIECNEARVGHLVRALDRLAWRLDRAGVASAAIEAGGVMLGTDLPEAAFAPGDIDLLVDGRGWEAVRVALLAEGFKECTGKAYPPRRLEAEQQGPDGISLRLEVTSRPFERVLLPSRVQDHSGEWLARRVHARKRGDSLCVLEPSEALALVTIHNSLHAYVRSPGLRLQVDVDRIVSDCQVDWDRFLDVVGRARARRRAALALALARSLLGTAVPTDVLQKLGSSEDWWARVVPLVSKQEVLANGHKKFRGWSGVWLEVMLDEEGALSWLESAVAPRAQWMRERFDPRESQAPLALLHFRRLLALLGKRGRRG